MATTDTPICIAVDLGYSSVKCAWRGEKTAMFTFPSMVSPAEDRVRRVTGLSKANLQVVGFAHHKFVVGEGQLVLSPQSRAGFTPESLAMVYCAIARALGKNTDGNVAVAIGVPIGFVRTGQSPPKLGEFVLNDRAYRPNYSTVLLMGQTVGAVLEAREWMREPAYQKAASSDQPRPARYIICDIGYGTTDFVVCDSQFRLVEAASVNTVRSAGFRKGVVHQQCASCSAQYIE